MKIIPIVYSSKHSLKALHRIHKMIIRGALYGKINAPESSFKQESIQKIQIRSCIFGMNKGSRSEVKEYLRLYPNMIHLLVFSIIIKYLAINKYM